jgi:hypothetical protein
MPEPRTLDTNSLSRALDRLRRESGALLVVAVRRDDVAFAADPALAPRDFGETLENEIPSLVQALAAQRTRRR